MKTELKKLNDAEGLTVAPGDPDPRGWQVQAVDGRDVGRVKDLIVDEHEMRARYLDVEVNPGLSRERDRHVLVPTEAVTIGDRERREHRISLPVTPESVIAAARPASPAMTAGGPEGATWPAATGPACTVRLTRGGNRG